MRVWCLPVLTALMLFAGQSSGETLSGYVLSVQDGETLVIADAQRQQTKVRLQGIAAPRRTQAFGEESRTRLAMLIFNKDVRFEPGPRKQGDFLVGKLMVQPPDCPKCPLTLDVGMAQIASGMAWFAVPQASELLAQDRAAYEHAEFEAKIRRVGLWRDKNPQPPWTQR